MKRLFAILTLVVLSLTSSPGVGASPEPERGLPGSWAATWTFTTSTVPFVTPGSSFQALHAFAEGGTVTSVNDDPFDTAGVGSWEKTGDGRHRFTIAFFLADDQNPRHAAAFFAYVTATIRYDARTDQWSGTFRTSLRDRSGNQIAEFTGTMIALRLRA